MHALHHLRIAGVKRKISILVGNRLRIYAWRKQTSNTQKKKKKKVFEDNGLARFENYGSMEEHDDPLNVHWNYIGNVSSNWKSCWQEEEETGFLLFFSFFFLEDRGSMRMTIKMHITDQTGKI
jgi:hypothetical protein